MYSSRKASATRVSADSKDGTKKLPKLPLTTLYLFSIILFIYYVSVNFFPFVSPNYDVLYTLGLHFNAPWSILTYMFIHLWPSHLVVDCLLLLVFGAIVERKVGGWKTLVIFLSSGFVGGLLNLAFFPSKTLIGSSGAVFGLIGAAIALNPFASFALFVAFLNFFAPFLARTIDDMEAAVASRIFEQRDSLTYTDMSLQRKIIDLSENRVDLNRTVAETGGLVSDKETVLKGLEADLRDGKITEEEFQRRSSETLGQIASLRQNLTNQSRALTLLNKDILESSQEQLQLVTEKVDAEERAIQMEYSSNTRNSTPQATWPHSIGLVVGAICLFSFRPSTFLEWEKRYDIVAGFLFRKRF